MTNSPAQWQPEGVGLGYQKAQFISYSLVIVVVCVDLATGSLKKPLESLPLFHCPWNFPRTEVAYQVVFESI